MKHLLFVVLLSVSTAATSMPDRLQEAAQLSHAHRFDEALTLLDRIVREQPDHGGAWIKMASIALVIGDVDKARNACRRAAIHVDPAVAIACQGRIAYATFSGREETLARILKLLSLPRYASRRDDGIIWARSVAAELAAVTGKVEIADRLFTRSIDDGAPEQVLVAYADHLLATGRPEHVLRLLEGPNGSYARQTRYLLALARVGADEMGRAKLHRLDRAFRQEIAQSKFGHAREIAFFYLHIMPDPELAELAARENILRQREPEDYELLALVSE